MFTQGLQGREDLGNNLIDKRGIFILNFRFPKTHPVTVTKEVTKSHKVPGRFKNVTGYYGRTKRGFRPKLIQKVTVPCRAAWKTPIQITGNILEYLLNPVIDIVDRKCGL
ncbi:MAG: hypothetical protein HLUCCA05_07420 [Roseibaca calidilacus]|uniref:Uncharacterized protein n=1 Tax=Roseibaca calidilacus TaxID=1666912 RepID=A0A0P7WS02_9RHOB|nr:MAG: hypothetical protein HLUCCA05_07420 [Roseibaca calidilacus]